MSDWAKNFRVRIDCPARVRSGEPFEIAVTSENVSGREIRRQTSSSFLGTGCEIEVRGQGGAKLFDGRIFATLDLRLEVVPAGAVIEKIRKFDGSAELSGGERVPAPVGKYDVIAANGQIFPSAVEVVE